MSIGVVSNSYWSASFPSADHYFQVSVGFEDDHITQAAKKNFCHKYLTMRLHRYGLLYTGEFLNKNVPSSRH